MSFSLKNRGKSRRERSKTPFTQNNNNKSSNQGPGNGFNTFTNGIGNSFNTFTNGIGNNSSIQIPVTDLKKYPKNSSDLVLNSQDGLLYYNNGGNWLPLNTGTTSIDRNGNLHLLAENNRLGTGGNIEITAGHGGLNDGEINFNISGEPFIKMARDGDLYLFGENSCLHCNIYKTSITDYSESTKAKTQQIIDDAIKIIDSAMVNNDVISMDKASTQAEKAFRKIDKLKNKKAKNINLHGTTSILTVNTKLAVNQTCCGTIRHGSLTSGSWIGLTPTVIGGSGIPLVWLSDQRDGCVTFNIKCIEGNLTKIDLHFELRNNCTDNSL